MPSMNENNQIVRDMTQSVYDEQREYTETELSADTTWIEASKIAFQHEEGGEFSGTDEDAAKYGMEMMGKFNYNMALGTVPMAAKIGDANDEQKLAFYYMMDAYDKKDISSEGTARFFKNLALDPTTYVGIGSLGWGFAGRQAASTAARTGLKSVLKESAKKYMQSTTAIAATEGAMFTAADDIARQEVAVQAGVQEEYDPTQTAVAGAIGAGAGAGLVKGGELAVKGVKAGAEQVGRWAEEGEQAMMEMAGGGKPPIKPIETLDPETVQKYIGAKGEEQTTASAKLDEALQNVEGDYEGTAIRGMLDTEGTLGKLEVGDDYITRGVTSIAKDKKTAETFVDRSWDKDTKGEKIYVNFESFINKPVNLGEGNKLGFDNVLDPKGGKYSFLEDEAVIPSGRKFVITKKEKIGDETHFTVKEAEQATMEMAGGGIPPKQQMKVVHNLSQSNLDFTNKYFDGQIPAPSVAITDKDVPFESFGEISLYGDKETINPKLSANKVFGADAYTKRTPRAEFKPNQKAYNEVIQITDDSTMQYQIKDYADEMLSGSKTSEQVAEFLMRRNPKTKDVYKQQTGQRYSEKKAKEWWAEKFDSVRGEAVFSTSEDYYNRKMKPYTADNIIKFIKKFKVQNSEGFNYGLGNTRAEGLKQLKSIKAIQERTTPLVTSDEMDMVKDEMNNKYFNLKSDLAPYSKYRDVDDDAFNEIIAGFMNGYDARAITSDFENVPDELLQELKSFSSEIVTAPTQYYEAKLLRAVDIGEFKGALVPKGTPKRIIDILKKKGLKVEKYADDRTATEKSFLEKNKEWLFVAPPLMVLSENMEEETNDK